MKKEFAKNSGLFLRLRYRHAMKVCAYVKRKRILCDWKNRNYWRGSEADLCKTISGRAWMADRNSIFPDGTRQEETTERLREIFENCRFVVLPVPVLRKGKLNTGAEYKPDAEQLMEYVKHGQCILAAVFQKN